MLRVGLTGGLGSGKTTVAAIFRSLGAQVMEADEVARAMMQPGEAVYAEIVRGLWAGRACGKMERWTASKLAKIAFHGWAPGGAECHCASAGDCRAAALDEGARKGAAGCGGDL